MILSEAMYVREIEDPPTTKSKKWEYDIKFKKQYDGSHIK